MVVPLVLTRSCRRLLQHSHKAWIGIFVVTIMAYGAYKLFFAPTLLVFGDIDIYPDSLRLDVLSKTIVSNGDASLHLYHQFQKFFVNDEMRKFMDDYKKNCEPVGLRLAAGLDNDWRNSLDVFLVNALALFLIANEPAIRSRHYFQLVFDKQRYLATRTVFTDMAEGTWCPFFESLDFAQQMNRTSAYREDFHLLTSKGSPVISTDSDILLLAHSAGSAEIRKGISHIVDRDGRREVFLRKAAMAKAIWQPKSDLKKALFVLWHDLLGSSRKYYGVHMAGGVAVETTAKKVIAMPFPVASSHVNLFVMTEERHALEELRKLISSRFVLYSLSDLLQKLELTVSNYVAPASDTVIHDRTDGSPNFFVVQTKQLAIEVTLLALADQLACSMVSSVCQLVTLLRGTYEKNLTNLDDNWNLL